MEQSASPRSAVFRLGAAFFRHLPAWVIFYIGVYCHLVALTSFNPPHRDWTWIYIFPEAIVLFYFYCYFKANARVKRSRQKLAGIFALQIAAFLAIYLLAEPFSFAQDIASWSAALKQMVFPPPAGTTIAWFGGRDTFVLLYEITSLIWNILIILYLYHYKRLGGLLFFYGAALLFGMTLESNGVMLKFFFEYDYHVYLPPFHAPLVTMFNWAAVLFICSWVLHGVQDAFPAVRRLHWFWGALAIAILALMIDLPIEPAATGLTLWTWNSALRSQPQLLGVPLLNFVSWFFAAGTFGAFYLYLTREGRGEYLFARRRGEIIEAALKTHEGKASARQRALAWVAALPEKMKDRPLRRAADFWRSDKGRWTPLARNLIMILVIPGMHLIIAIGIVAATLLTEGADSPVFSILRKDLGL
jgi:hypothetical protein